MNLWLGIWFRLGWVWDWNRIIWRKIILCGLLDIEKNYESEACVQNISRYSLNSSFSWLVFVIVWMFELREPFLFFPAASHNCENHIHIWPKNFYKKYLFHKIKTVKALEFNCNDTYKFILLYITCITDDGIPLTHHHSTEGFHPVV